VSQGNETGGKKERILYATAVFDQDEIDSVMGVLAKGPNGIRIGENVAAAERAVAELTGKRHGIMVDSGSAALFLAVELLDLPRGSEVITSPLTFSTDISALVRAGLVPVFVDVEPDTFNVDAKAIEAEIGPQTRAILIPNLAGNAPDWDVIREVADRHGLTVIEDSCDALGATLRGTPTAARADITVTSFSPSHIVTGGGSGGMVCLDDEALWDRCVTLRGWGRRSEVQIYGSKGDDHNFWTDVDGMHYDNMFIFDELGWNFLPSEISAAFLGAQLRKLPVNHGRRQRNFELYSSFLASRSQYFVPPRQTDGLETAWLSYCFQVRPDAGFSRADLQAGLSVRGIDTRTVWTGNAARQPMMKGVAFRQPEGGLPNADAVMQYGVLLSCSHSLSDDDIRFVCSQIDDFLESLPR
jgi:CDP-4-dehydro-6-deoxyglucose reductase, E1